MIVNFPREHQPHVEILRIRDRNDGRVFYVFDLVGSDEDGPFRIDMGHCHSFDELTDTLAYYWQHGIKVDGSAVFA